MTQTELINTHEMKNINIELGGNNTMSPYGTQTTYIFQSCIFVSEILIGWLSYLKVMLVFFQVEMCKKFCNESLLQTGKLIANV